VPDAKAPIRQVFAAYRAAVFAKDPEATNRLPWVLQPDSGECKIIHEHTSAPVPHDTLKAMLQR
jgi:hypothetical protein